MRMKAGPTALESVHAGRARAPALLVLGLVLALLGVISGTAQAQDSATELSVEAQRNTMFDV